MRKKILLFVLILLFISNKSIVYAEEFDSRFKDINFYDCIYNKLAERDISFLDVDGNFKDGYLDKIIDLNCSDRGVSDISGIEYLTNLKTFILSSSCSVVNADLSSNLELEKININCGTLEKVKLGQKNSLKELDLSNNKISDMEISSYSTELLTNVNLMKNNFSSKPTLCSSINDTCLFGYIVTFDSQDGNILTQNTDSIVIKPDNPSKGGYKFSGWYLNGELYDFATKVTSDITLVAGWEYDELAQESEFISTSNSVFNKIMITVISLFVAFCFGFIAYTLLNSKTNDK